jgi:hypothetical protein
MIMDHKYPIWVVKSFVAALFRVRREAQVKICGCIMKPEASSMKHEK